MTQISLTDDAIIRLLQSCSFPGVTVLSSPHAWDAGYVQRLISVTPSILVAFLGADDPDAKLTELNLDGRWGIYIATGWHGADQKARRLGAGAGFDLMHRAAAALHNAILLEENGERLPQVRVDGLQVLADSSLDLSNLWIGEIAVTVELPLELMPSDACYGPLDDFLKVRATFDLPGGKPTPDIGDAGDAGDFPAQIDLPQ